MVLRGVTHSSPSIQPGTCQNHSADRATCRLDGFLSDYNISPACPFWDSKPFTVWPGLASPVSRLTGPASLPLLYSCVQSHHVAFLPWSGILILPLSNWMTLGKVFNLSEPQFPGCQKQIRGDLKNEFTAPAFVQTCAQTTPFSGPASLPLPVLHSSVPGPLSTLSHSPSSRVSRSLACLPLYLVLLLLHSSWPCMSSLWYVPPNPFLSYVSENPPSLSGQRNLQAFLCGVCFSTYYSTSICLSSKIDSHLLFPPCFRDQPSQGYRRLWPGSLQ